MDKYRQFYSSLDKAVTTFRGWDKSKPIHIISHLDADGISACAILISVLNKENRKYSISILQQLTREKIEDIAKDDFKYIIFADLGSGQLKDISNLLNEKEILILDHHQPEEADSKNICHINPHVLGIDGSKEIAGSGVVYLFARALSKENEKLAHLAIIGAIGDVQEEEGFMRLNKEILETAVKQGKITVEKGLRLFGRNTKPLHKVLEYSTDPYIPGVTGSESGAIQFLHQIGIEPKNGKQWKKIVHLNDEEMQRLVIGIIMKRFGETNPEDVLGDIYILTEEEEESPTRDAKEFATLLNACGRMDNASFGIGACLGIEKDKQRAIETLTEYKKQIVNAINWYHDNKHNMAKGKGFVIINAKDNIPSTIIGTLASILSKSNGIEEGTYVLSIARSNDKMSKASLRISGLRGQDIDLRDIIKEIVAKSGGEAGGHKHAAGAWIETEKEDVFLEAAQEILSRK